MKKAFSRATGSADAGHPLRSRLRASSAHPHLWTSSRTPRILRWFLEEDETLGVVGLLDQHDALGPISAIFSGAKEKFAAARDKRAARALVAVTDRRIITAMTNAFLEQGEIRLDVPFDQVRNVRAATTQDRGGRLANGLITRDENIRWLFRADLDNAQVDALAAVLAESTTLPDVERDELQGRNCAPTEADRKGEITGTWSTKLPGSHAATCDAE
ncbi:hypothetical protein [Streptomyces sp. 021-4]|uniref:hypothetical protein n=1 Tax=Streptomyces sp. 021-4 TaxID=2789260 RepID=UPI0039F4675C